MMILKHVITLAVALAFSGVTHASDLSAIQSLISSGQYSSASEQAELIQTPESYALAAEALLSEIMLGEVEKNKKQAKRARKLAEAALELDPTYQNARLQYAIAHGFVTRETGDVSAWMKKLPQKTQNVVESYRADFPDDTRGDALLGAWHLAIVRKAGNDNARKWFDANIADGQRLYNKAVETDPNDIIICLNYAFALIGLSEEDMPDVTQAQQILEGITAQQPSNHLERTALSYGREALVRLDDRDAARDYVGMFLDGKKPE